MNFMREAIIEAYDGINVKDGGPLPYVPRRYAPGGNEFFHKLTLTATPQIM